MLKFFKKLLQASERRKHGRQAVHATVKFRILDGKNPAISSRIIDGKVIDMSPGGLCIGTNTVHIDGLHIFHHATSMYKNKLEIEVELHPDQPPLRTLGEASWYDRSAEGSETVYKFGVNWGPLSKSDRQVLESFLAQGGR